MKQTRMSVEEVESKPVFEAVQTLPAIYAVKNRQQDILPIHSLKQAQEIARKTAGAVWEILIEGEEVIFIYPVNL